MQLDLNKPPLILKDQERAALYKRVFESKDGQLLCEDLAQASGFYQGIHPDSDPVKVMFMQGGRHLFLYICSQIQDVHIEKPPTHQGESIPWKI